MRIKRIKVRVTAEDIIRGTPRKGSECPVALASKRVLNPIRMTCLSVNLEQMLLDYFSCENFRGGFVRTATPRSVREFIRAFDFGGDLKPRPFAFFLKIPRRPNQRMRIRKP